MFELSSIMSRMATFSVSLQFLDTTYESNRHLKEMDFYVVLRSTDSTLFHPSNCANRFTVQIDEQISLDGQWYTSLVEIGINKRVKGLRDIYMYAGIV